MKQLLYILVFGFSVFGFAQNTGSISGNLLDLEEGHAPLLYAKVMVKETGVEALSNEAGFFKFEDVKPGAYTLVYSFVGYETKEVKVEVLPSNDEVLKLHLGASTVSLDDLASVFASASSASNDSAIVSNK
ncbi:carboxypeptidase-like regulatory domain-containing protein [Pseudotamlana carrageenivorans]|uniref:TonB-dependent receptor n=1 Tax=Pseudotamlana carrageenivorans TaxID=2069432 RepID=A0A2I7SHM6_9FLAO|nr:carboxypeptidase-like regulatory domain-containing protein [Tamlana carrageenivorans]AUS05402.1 TonB-dependent receptor [Tamlana carrageenivorans]